MAELPSATAALDVLRLLIATDAFPRGGLYAGHYSTSAALRYEAIWLTVLREYVVKGGSISPIPPLDVAFAWFVHRQFPVSYANVTHRRCGRAFHPPREAAFTFGSSNGSSSNGGDVGGSGAVEVSWKSVAGDIPAWPPPAPGSDFDLVAGHTDWRPTLASQLASCMSRVASLLHSWLRPHFLDALFLERARDRYGRFLALLAAQQHAHPHTQAGGGPVLVPSADIALFWHTHLGLSGEYAAAWKAQSQTLTQAQAQLLGADGGAAPPPPPRPTYLDLEGGPLRAAYSNTARLYEQTYGEPYDSPDTAWLRPSELHPLAGPASPLAFALRAFDEVPSAAAAVATAAAAEADGGAASGGSGGSPEQSHLHLHLPSLHISPRGAGTISSPGVGGGGGGFLRNTPGGVTSFSSPLRRRPHPRAGGHALFAAWLASSAASDFIDRQTCRGLCFGGGWSIKVGAVERMVVPLVLLPYMRGLPDSSGHPFLAAVTQRRGGSSWSPPLGPVEDPAGAEAEAGVEERERERQGAEAAEAEGSGRQQYGSGTGSGSGTAAGGPLKPLASSRSGTGDVARASGSGAMAPVVEGGGSSPDGVGVDAAAAEPPEPASISATATAAAASPFAAAAGRAGRRVVNLTVTTTAAAPPADGTVREPGAHKVSASGGGDGRPSYGGGGRGSMYLGGGYQLGDAEGFLDDPTLCGLTALMEQIAAAGGSGAGGGGSGLSLRWGRAPREEEEDEEEEEGFLPSGGDSGRNSANPLGAGASGRGSRHERAAGGGGAAWEGPLGGRTGAYGGTAPLWGILQKPEYGKRARALFQHFWVEVGRRGPEFLQQQQGGGLAGERAS